MQIQRTEDHLLFWNESGVCQGSIYFWIEDDIKFFSSPLYRGYNRIENIFDIVKEPFLTALLFNIDLLEEIFEGE